MPLLENKKGLRFLAFGFLVSWVCVSCFVGFLVSKSYQMSISCLLKDIDPIPKIFKIFFNGSSSFVGARLFHNR